MINPITFAYFGGEPLSVPILQKLKNSGFVPKLIVCNPDRPTGRHHTITPPPTKIWAESEGIKTFQPTTYKDNQEVQKIFSQENWDLFVVVAYNFILPQWLLKIPKYGSINVHPSLLPKLRGASPIRTAILRNEPEHVGATIIQMDEQMDHGPIITQKSLNLTEHEWPVSGPLLDEMLAQLGGSLLTEVIPAWVDGKIIPQQQNHENATYCGKLNKEDCKLNINPHLLPKGDEAKKAWFVIQAFSGIGGTFFTHGNKRVKITEAKLTSNNELIILRVIPEGKKEMDFKTYLQSIS